MKVDLTTATPLGMMLNEIMMNSFKHSMKENSSGRITVRFEKSRKDLVIDYHDMQGNIPAGIELKNATSTGMTLIHTFAEQLDGEISLVSRSPIHYRIIIPNND